MKNIKKLFILLLVVVLVGGCTLKTEYNMDIKSDKSMDLSAIMAFDSELIAAMANNDTSEESTEGDIETDSTLTEDNTLEDNSLTEGETTNEGVLSEEETNESITEEETIDGNIDSSNLTDEQEWAIIEENYGNDAFEDYEKAGYKITRYEEGDFKGYKLTKSFSNIEDVTVKDVSFTAAEDVQIKDADKKIFTKDGLNYVANIPFETSSELSSMGVAFDMKFVITLPNEAISNNANNVTDNGKTLTWNVTDDNENISFEFSFISKYVIYGAIGVIALLVLIIIIVIIRKIMKRNKKKKEEKTNNEVVTPASKMPGITSNPVVSEPSVTEAPILNPSVTPMPTEAPVLNPNVTPVSTEAPVLNPNVTPMPTEAPVNTNNFESNNLNTITPNTSAETTSLANDIFGTSNDNATQNNNDVEKL